MNNDAHAVRQFFQSTVPNAIRRSTSPRAFESSRFHFPNKPLSASMGRPPAARKPSRRRSTSQIRSRSRSPRKTVTWREDEKGADDFQCDGLPPAVLRVSVNIRYSRTQQPLLPLDVFVAVPAGAQLADVYARAAAREPDNAMASYKLRRDKRVYILCSPSERGTFANVDDTAASILDLSPLRIIFCVEDGPPTPPPPAGLLLNASVFGSGKDILPEDVELDGATPSCTVEDVWKRAVRAVPKLSRYEVRCLGAKRPADGVGLRIGLKERVADVATLGAERYVFELGSDKSMVVDREDDDVIRDDEFDEEEEDDDDDGDYEDENALVVEDESYDSLTESYYDDDSGDSADTNENDSVTLFSYNHRAKQPRSILRKSTSSRSVGRR